MEKVQEIIDVCLGKNIPFVIFRLPGESRVKIRIQLSGKIIYVENAADVIESEGFIYAPFHRKTNFPVIFFEPEVVIDDKNIDDLLLKKIRDMKPLYSNYPVDEPESTPKSEYLENARRFISSFDNNFTKAVLSRVQVIKKPAGFNAGKFFIDLMKAYPAAFCHLIHIPGAGTWAGATPETLLRSDEDITKTVSLAGTLPIDKTEEWSNKESEEQQIVTRYIEEVFSKFDIESYKKDDTNTVMAGNAVHLSTRFRFNTAKVKGKLGEFIEVLHPTPAVCGYPKEKALELILKTEKHNREYYSGFIGTVNVDNRTDLFVNLRCMKILGDKIALYAGGGLTKDSVPEKEWEETVLKAGTLLSLL